ncbi:MAG: short-chain dehydrogenase [Lentisphaerae bacterium RIFOXYA12_FULL_48_11]|nr:MAG: short-chain dehydrogenase [Lentisphaerae bacterium RIFOXYA12_FULL_48_11]
MDTLFSLAGKTAVITGGMGQLGIEYASSFFERGAFVSLIDISDKPKAYSSSFEQGLKSGRIKAYKADITDKKSIEHSAAAIISDAGVPHILINNAALDSPPDAPVSEVGPFEAYPEESFDKVMDVNVKGTFLCSQIFGGHMALQGRGSIINISSIYGMLSPCQDIYEYRRKAGEVFFKPVAYSVSKSGISNLTRYLATYWAKKGVRVNTLTLAGVFNKQPQGFLDAYCARMPMGRMANADEYVGAVVFLASDASSYMTGSNLVIDGGWSAW